ncbi:MAG TPA: hypothetical protein VGL86_05130 [Polyangia bacterium]
MVIADEDLGVLYVWYGDAGFQVLDENGKVLDAFSSSTAFSRKLTVREARAVINAYRRDADEDGQ